MVASFLSGLAGAITQISLQVGNRDSLLFTVELCAASILIILASFLTSEDGSQIWERGFFDEWTLSTIVPILTNSVGGILVGLVIKYAGTVPKGFALIFGIALTGMVQSHNEKKALSKEKVVGGVLVAVSLWMHATNSYVEQKSRVSQATVAESRKED
jgi:UDP-sugar transporter A1/2/3